MTPGHAGIPDNLEVGGGVFIDVTRAIMPNRISVGGPQTGDRRVDDGFHVVVIGGEKLHGAGQGCAVLMCTVYDIEKLAEEFAKTLTIIRERGIDAPSP